MPDLPMLRMGSVGDVVRTLQKALNLGPTNLERLDEDANFGPKTRGRVVEFQAQSNLSQDGVVGPMTWEALEPLLQAVEAIIDQIQPASDEEAQRDKIVTAAEFAFAAFGWGEKGTVKPDGSGRIAAAQGFGPYLGGRRARQGGATLASIYLAAGVATASKCPMITKEIEGVYQKTKAQLPKRRDILNQQDIGSWCGIFATYCYRLAGLHLSWDDVKTQSPKYFEKLTAQAEVKRGDIGVYHPEFNHHFVVIKDAAPGERVYSIDGNVGNPAEKDVVPWNSVISKRFYLRSTLGSQGGMFLRPKFAAIAARGP